MIVVVLTVAALFLVGFAASALEDRAPKESSGTLDALLFLLCLVGIVAAKRKRESEDEY